MDRERKRRQEKKASENTWDYYLNPKKHILHSSRESYSGLTCGTKPKFNAYFSILQLQKHEAVSGFYLLCNIRVIHYSATGIFPQLWGTLMHSCACKQIWNTHCLSSAPYPSPDLRVLHICQHNSASNCVCQQSLLHASGTRPGEYTGKQHKRKWHSLARNGTAQSWPQGSLLPDGPAARSGTILQSWRSSVCVARTHVPLERQGTTTVAEAKRPTLPLLGEVSADITFTGVTVAVAEGTWPWPPTHSPLPRCNSKELKIAQCTSQGSFEAVLRVSPRELGGFQQQHQLS